MPQGKSDNEVALSSLLFWIHGQATP